MKNIEALISAYQREHGAAPALSHVNELAKSFLSTQSGRSQSAISTYLRTADPGAVAAAMAQAGDKTITGLSCSVNDAIDFVHNVTIEAIADCLFESLSDTLSVVMGDLFSDAPEPNEPAFGVFGQDFEYMFAEEVLPKFDNTQISAVMRANRCKTIDTLFCAVWRHLLVKHGGLLERAVGEIEQDLAKSYTHTYASADWEVMSFAEDFVRKYFRSEWTSVRKRLDETNDKLWEIYGNKHPG